MFAPGAICASLRHVPHRDRFRSASKVKADIAVLFCRSASSVTHSGHARLWWSASLQGTGLAIVSEPDRCACFRALVRPVHAALGAAIRGSHQNDCNEARKHKWLRAWLRRCGSFTRSRQVVELVIDRNQRWTSGDNRCTDFKYAQHLDNRVTYTEYLLVIFVKHSV